MNFLKLIDKVLKFLMDIDKSVYKNLLIGFDIALIGVEIVVYFGYAFSYDEIPEKIGVEFALLFPLTISLIPITNLIFKKKFNGEEKKTEDISVNTVSTIKKQVSKKNIFA